MKTHLSHFSVPLTFLTVVTALFMSSPATGDVVFTSQSRSIEAEACAAQCSHDEAAAPDFGPFDETVSVSEWDGQIGEAAAVASQSSTISPTLIEAVGSTWSSESPGSLEGSVGGPAFSSTLFSVQFDLTEGVHYDLTANLFQEERGASLRLQLIQNGIAIVDQQATEYPMDYQWSGGLVVGSYEFRITASGRAYTHPFGTEPEEHGITDFDADLVLTPNSVGVGERAHTPSRILGSCPNPFNPDTVIRFELATTGGAVLGIFDAQGRQIREYHEAGLSAGVHELLWDGRDGTGRLVASGTYWVRMQTPDGSDTIPVALIK